MLFKNLILLLSSYTSLARAGAAWKTEFHGKEGAAEFWSCEEAIEFSGYTYDFTPGVFGGQYSIYYDGLCGYPPNIASQLLCISRLTDRDSDSMKKYFEFYNEKCSDYSNYNPGWEFYKDQFLNATENEVDASTIANISLPIYVAVAPNMTLAQQVYSGYKPFYINLDDATYFGAGLCVYWGVVMLFATIFNFMTKTGLIQKLSNPYINIIRSYVTIPAMYPKGRHAQAWGGWKYFTGLFPDRLDTLIITGFTILHIVFWCYPYHASPNHSLLWGNFDTEYQRYIADRTGILSFAEVPLLILFAGRNSLLTFFTGIKYSSFIQFHKCVARYMFFDAMIHSVAYTVYVSGYYRSEFTELYWTAGVVATILAGLLWLFSFHPIRNYGYEIFLYSHILLAVGFIVMCWYHCNTLGWCEWIIAACAFWVFDRIIRICRMSLFGYQSAEIELLNEDTFKVVVRKPKTFSAKPGQFGYVYFSDWLLWFQNHPFTILNDGDSLVFFIKVKRGITSRIHKQLLKSGGKLTKRVCVEGPYGEHSPVGKYQNTLLITGGAGVPGIFEHALDLSQRSSPQNVKFIWIHKSFADLQQYVDSMLIKLKDTRVIVDVYLTRETGFPSSKGKGNSSSETIFEKEQDISADYPPFINFKFGRPNIEQVLAQEINAFGGGSVGIAACGPPKLMDDLKHAVSREVVQYKERIDYFDEYQIW